MLQPQEHKSWTPNIGCKIEMSTSACFFTDTAGLKPNLIWWLLICSLSPLAKQDLEMKSLPTDCVQKQFVKMRTCNTALLTLAHPPVTSWTQLKSPAPESQSRLVSPTCMVAKQSQQQHFDSGVTLQNAAESCRPNPRLSPHFSSHGLPTKPKISCLIDQVVFEKITNGPVSCKQGS